MPAAHSYDYAIVRVVPRVERSEFVNAGVILFCRVRRYLNAAIDLDRERLRALTTCTDVDEVERHLAAFPLVCAGGSAAGPIGALSMAERFHWLVSPRSTLVQPSPVHCGLCDDPASELEHLLNTMVRRLE